MRKKPKRKSDYGLDTVGYFKGGKVEAPKRNILTADDPTRPQDKSRMPNVYRGKLQPADATPETVDARTIQRET